MSGEEEEEEGGGEHKEQYVSFVWSPQAPSFVCSSLREFQGVTW